MTTVGSGLPAVVTLAAVALTAVGSLHGWCRWAVPVLRPQLAARCLPPAVLTVALGTWLTASAVGVTAVLAPTAPARVLGVAVLGVLAVLLARATRVALAGIGHLRRHAPGPDGATVLDGVTVPDGVTVLDGVTVGAVALPARLWGGDGTVAVSTTLLQTLSPTELAGVLAHERAHLRHRHHLAVLVAEVAAALCPPLGRVRTATRQQVERCADEVAAGEVDRGSLAGAVATAALARRAGALGRGDGPPTGPPTVPAGLGAADGDVVSRVRALLAPPRARSSWRATAALGVLLTVVVAVSVAAADVDQDHLVFERGEVPTAVFR